MRLKHWLLPNKTNKFHPVALRPSGLFVFLAIFIAITPVYNIIATGKAQILGYATNINVNDLLAISNQERINNGLPSLNLNYQLNNASLAKANDMFTDNYWAHVAPDGTQPWSFIIGAGYDYNSAGENLAKDFNTSSGVINGWLSSPSHRANVLNANYKDIGYAVVNGTLLGTETTLVVAMYGNPVEQVVATAETNPVEESPVIVSQQNPTENATQSTTPNSVKQSTPLSQTQSDPIANENSQEYPKAEITSTNITKTEVQPKVIEKTPLKSSTTAVLGAVISVPIDHYISLNWGQKASLLLTSTMVLLFVMNHTIIWREHKRGAKHIWLRAHPLGQGSILAITIIITLANGVGVVL